MKARAWLVLCAWLAVATFSAPATPCGAFATRASRTVPNVVVEQTMIVFDPEREQEHFVRELAIRDPGPGFGFVIPVPERPVVAKVEIGPFDRLARTFPVGSRFSLGGVAKGSGGGNSAAAPVSVLSHEKVGSFTAFVLAASDANALQKWFSDNQLLVPPETQAWLTQYVKLRFYLVALRYEAQEIDQKSTTWRGETVRISFKSALPFYPYREPTPPTPNAAPRELAVWLVSQRMYTPVSLFEPGTTAQAGAASQWKRPWLEYEAGIVDRESMAAALSEELMKLLPFAAGRGRITLQVFEDQKRSRAGFGDIVMVPRDPTALTGSTLTRSRKLMALLDPAVTP